MPTNENAERRALVWRRMAVLLVSLTAARLLGISTVTVLLVRDTQVDNTTRNRSTEQAAKDAAAAAEAARKSTDLIADCTTPGRLCFERGQRRTAKAVASINEVVVLAASCASGPEEKSVQEIQSCVIERLAGD